MLFGQMVQLTRILAEILETFYTLQASQAAANAGSQATQLILSLAKPIQLKLKEWYSGLPAVVRMDSTFQSSLVPSNRLSSTGYLHLAYFATEITLHRRIIRSMDASAAAAAAAAAAATPSAGTPQFASPIAGSPSPSLATSTAGGGVDPYIQHICRSAAKARLISAMDFVNRLTPSHLRAFWYFASKTNFALIGTFGSLLWATSPGREEADWYRRRLGEYRWTLSVSSKPGPGPAAAGSGGDGGGRGSKGAGLTEFAMGMLDISTGLLKKLPEKPLLSRSGSAVDFDAARRQSMLALGGIGGGVGSASVMSMSALSASVGGHGYGFGRGGAGGGGGGGFGMGMTGGLDQGYGSAGGMHSAEASGMQSPRSVESESSEEGVYGNFSATAGMAGLGD